jgi:hypothetical protein
VKGVLLCNLGKIFTAAHRFNCFIINIKCTSIFNPYNDEADMAWVLNFWKSLAQELTTQAPVIFA